MRSRAACRTYAKRAGSRNKTRRVSWPRTSPSQYGSSFGRNGYRAIGDVLPSPRVWFALTRFSERAYTAASICKKGAENLAQLGYRSLRESFERMIHREGKAWQG
jgi:hypothetical protein